MENTLPIIMACPFCKSEGDYLRVVEDDTDVSIFFVYCNGCNASGPECCGDCGAVALWNAASSWRQ